MPAEQYETEVNGEDISKVRLFVGRTNQNAAENKAFAQQIKAEADREYPGLIKDIFIGKGNYNQDLSPNSLLLEFGTHEIDKEKAQEATGYIAEVLDNVLFGPAARAEGAAKPAHRRRGQGHRLGRRPRRDRGNRLRPPRHRLPQGRLGKAQPKGQRNDGWSDWEEG